jgi:hypothetical protein
LQGGGRPHMENHRAVEVTDLQKGAVAFVRAA